MDRAEFEALRDLPGKVIRGDIRLIARKHDRPNALSKVLAIENTLDVDLRMQIRYNAETNGIVINVYTLEGPICRLCVRGVVHRGAGRTHKHSLLTPRCQTENNLADGVVPRTDLQDKSLRTVFRAFCLMSQIEHDGRFFYPDEILP